MRNNIYQRLIERVATRDWVEAQGLFKSILEQKIALRLEAEKKLLSEPDEPDDLDDGSAAEKRDIKAGGLKEATALKECPECGCEFDPSKGSHGQYTECSGCYDKKSIKEAGTRFGGAGRANLQRPASKK